MIPFYEDVLFFVVKRYYYNLLSTAKSKISHIKSLIGYYSKPKSYTAVLNTIHDILLCYSKSNNKTIQSLTTSDIFILSDLILFVCIDYLPPDDFFKAIIKFLHKYNNKFILKIIPNLVINSTSSASKQNILILSAALFFFDMFANYGSLNNILALSLDKFFEQKHSTNN